MDRSISFCTCSHNGVPQTGYEKTGRKDQNADCVQENCKPIGMVAAGLG